MSNYLCDVWAARYFWIHLSMSDLRSKWQRSFFGLLWSAIQPLGLTVLLAIVFGKIFKTDIARYAPYILSGVIVWDCIAASVTGGSLAFVQADAYIKQANRPLAIYTLRTVITHLSILTIASLGLILWVLLTIPENIGFCWVAALLIFPILGIILWPAVTILAYLGARFRDVPHALALSMQALWFISPVYFDARVFRDAGLGGLVDYNPVYHVLQFVRAPLLEGQWPSWDNLLFSLVTAAILSLVAWQVGKKFETSTIFYL